MVLILSQELFDELFVCLDVFEVFNIVFAETVLYLFQLTFHTLREVDTLDEFLGLILCYLRNHAFFDPHLQHLDWHVPSDVRFDP